MYVDEAGLPYSDYGVYLGIDIGRQRSILSVAERGLWCWNQFDLGDDKVLLSYDWNKWPVNREKNPTDLSEALRVFRSCVIWMLREIHDNEDFAVWIYPYPMAYGTASGWRSAHAQATGLQLLVRAALYLREPEFLKPVDRLLSAFDVPVEDGGLLDISEASIPWFEKFADPGNRKPKVLNGLLFAIIGLRDVHNYTGNSHALKLANTGLESALALMPRFDLEDWSAYDIEGKRATPHYHDIHIRQLALLARETGDERLLAWHDRFVAYSDMALLKSGKLKLPSKE